jgi:hypothetical protein
MSRHEKVHHFFIKVEIVEFYLHKIELEFALSQSLLQTFDFILQMISKFQSNRQKSIKGNFIYQKSVEIERFPCSTNSARFKKVHFGVNIQSSNIKFLIQFLILFNLCIQVKKRKRNHRTFMIINLFFCFSKCMECFFLFISKLIYASFLFSNMHVIQNLFDCFKVRGSKVANFKFEEHSNNFVMYIHRIELRDLKKSLIYRLIS